MFKDLLCPWEMVGDEKTFSQTWASVRFACIVNQTVISITLQRKFKTGFWINLIGSDFEQSDSAYFVPTYVCKYTISIRCSKATFKWTWSLLFRPNQDFFDFFTFCTYSPHHRTCKNFQFSIISHTIKKITIHWLYT